MHIRVYAGGSEGTNVADPGGTCCVADGASRPGGRSRSKHRLQAFGSCSRFVHYARRHAFNELKTRGIPVGVALPVRAPAPVSDGQQVVMPESAPAPAAGGGAAQDFSTT